MKILFVCTSNKDRSISLEKHFSLKYPQHDYISAGVNKYFTSKHNSHLITDDDIKTSDLIILAENIHLNMIEKYHKNVLGDVKYHVLSIGEYDEMSKYLEKAENILIDKFPQIFN